MATELLSKPASGMRFALAQTLSANLEIADAYDSLFGSLRLARPLASGNSVLLTSTEPGEGKTTVSLCLAATAARAGQRVLLIDGDLRRSSLASTVGSVDGVGLIEVLLGQAGADEAIQPLAGLVDAPRTGSVCFMSGGLKPAISLGAVDWSKARAVFRSISQRFGIVFLDSPPVLAVNDALLFASMVDAVVLIVGAGKANLDEIKSVKEQLAATGAPIIGAVLNRFEPKVHGRSNRPYSGYYNSARVNGAD